MRVEKEGNPTIIGVDIWKPYIRKIKRFKVYDSLVIADVRFLPFRRRVFNIVLACEILEHLPKDDAEKVLREVEMVAKGMIIVSTPLGFMEQDVTHGNPYQKHISAWQPEDLEKNGYDVQILEGNLPSSFKEIIAYKNVGK